MPTRYVETPAFLGMLRRMLRAAAQRAAAGDAEDLANLLELHAELGDAVVEAVRGLRAAGYTWSELAAATGTSKEAAIQKWASKVKASEPGPSETPIGTPCRPAVQHLEVEQRLRA